MKYNEQNSLSVYIKLLRSQVNFVYKKTKTKQNKNKKQKQNKTKQKHTNKNKKITKKKKNKIIFIFNGYNISFWWFYQSK